jgi:hypothetical protein
MPFTAARQNRQRHQRHGVRLLLYDKLHRKKITLTDRTGNTACAIPSFQSSAHGFRSRHGGQYHPWSTELAGLAFPLPAAVKDAKGTCPLRRLDDLLCPDRYVAYYEKYSDGTWAFYTTTRKIRL